MQQQPNLLMIIVDQERAVQHFPENWEQDNMPAMRLLKKHGLSFENAFCNACMCSPSRSTLMTSLYAPQHGVTDTLTFGGKFAATQVELDPALPNIAKMLRKDYDVQYRGKWHLNKGGQNKVQAAQKALMSSEVAIYGFNGWIAPDAGEDMKLENFGGGYTNHDAIYVKQAIDFVEDWQKRKEEAKRIAAATGEEPNIKPFFLVLSLVNPHDVLSYPQTYKDGGYDDSWLEGPINPSPTADEEIRLYKPTAQTSAKLGMISSMGSIHTPEKMTRYINFYGNLMSLVDNELMNLLELFYPKNPLQPTEPRKVTDLARDTWIVRVADHGEMGTSHGGLRQKSYNVYEESLKIPMVFSRAGYFKEENAKTSQMISLIDILPTLSGLLDVKQDYDIRGKDLSATIDHNPPKVLTTNHLVFTFDDIQAPVPTTPEPVPAADRIRCVRTRFWKFARYFRADGSYQPEYEMYFLIDMLSEKGDPPTDIDLEINKILPLDDPDLLQVIDRFPFEQANFANEGFIEMLESKKIVSSTFIERIAKVRELMAAYLAKREEDIYITQEHQKGKFEASLKGL